MAERVFGAVFARSLLPKELEIVRYTTYQLMSESPPANSKPIKGAKTSTTSTGTSTVVTLRGIAKWCMGQGHSAVEIVADIGYHLLSLGAVFGIKLLIWTRKMNKQSVDTLITELYGGLLAVNNAIVNSDLNVEANLLHSVNLLLESAQPARSKGQQQYLDVVNDPHVFSELTAGTSQSNRLHVVSINRVER
eukprot:gene44537-55409_t